MDKELINALNNYFVSEFGEDAIIDKLPNDRIVHLAYTVNDDGAEIQVDFDIKNLKYLNYIDDELVLEEKRTNIQEFIKEIENCSFSDIICNCFTA